MTQQCSLDAEQIPATYFVTARHRSQTLAPQNGVPRLTVKIFLDWNRSFSCREIQQVICDGKNSAGKPVAMLTTISTIWLA